MPNDPTPARPELPKPDAIINGVKYWDAGHMVLQRRKALEEIVQHFEKRRLFSVVQMVRDFAKERQ